MKNNILAFLLIGFLFLGCNDKGLSLFSGVEIDKEGMKLVDTYLADPDLEAFYPKLQVSRSKIIESYEKEYTKKYADGVKASLSYDKKTYDKDFENEVTISIKSSDAHRVQVKSAFFSGILNVTDNGFNKTYKVSGVDEKDLQIMIEKILPPNTEYITKNYANLSAVQKTSNAKQTQASIPNLPLFFQEENDWKAIIEITCFDKNKVCGTANFNSINCGGDLIYKGKKDSIYEFEEKLNYGKCTAGCDIRIDMKNKHYEEYCKGKKTGGGFLLLK